MNTSDTVISLTTIPRRLETSLPIVLDSLRRQSLKCPIIINIPKSYQKWGADFKIPPELTEFEHCVLFRNKTDYGPATKLLGAIDYAEMQGRSFNIITVDDDITFRSRYYLDYILGYSKIIRNTAITVGGIKMLHPPYKKNNGLKYRLKFAYADIPAGFKAVFYPSSVMKFSDRFRETLSVLPIGIRNDDDAYFGIVLCLCGIPLYAVPSLPGGGAKGVLEGGTSAVEELTNLPRSENESQIYQHAVHHGFLPSARKIEFPEITTRIKIAMFYHYLKFAAAAVQN